MRILIVDDSKAMLAVLARTLKQAGWNVETATDAASALLKIDDVDLLVTDLKMPGMDGMEFMKNARQRRPGLQTIVMTGYGTIPSAIEAMKHGARAYFTKPFGPEELLAHFRQVQELLELRKAAAAVGRGDLVGTCSPYQSSMAAVRPLLARGSWTRTTVLSRISRSR